jgi:hypothetical protein
VTGYDAATGAQRWQSHSVRTSAARTSAGWVQTPSSSRTASRAGRRNTVDGDTVVALDLPDMAERWWVPTAAGGYGIAAVGSGFVSLVETRCAPT